MIADRSRNVALQTVRPSAEAETTNAVAVNTKQLRRRLRDETMGDSDQACNPIASSRRVVNPEKWNRE
jgi:hypothetical protein